METFYTVEQNQSIRGRIYPFDLSIAGQFKGRQVSVEIAAGNTPKSLESAVQRTSDAFIAIDIKSPGLKKIKRFANGKAPQNFLYLHGEDYLNLFDSDLNINQVDIFFPVPVDESAEWIENLVNKVKLTNRKLKMNVFTEIPYKSVTLGDGLSPIYRLKCDFISELSRIFTENNLVNNFKEYSFDEFHSIYGVTEFSEILSRTYMRRGVAHFEVSI